METYGLENLGIYTEHLVYRNLAPSALIEHTLVRHEGHLNDTGALVVLTGDRTGRSANDKFIVDSPDVHDAIAWGDVNHPVSPSVFNALWNRMVDYFSERAVYIFDGFAGASKAHQKSFRVINEMPSQNLFIQQLLIKPTPEQLEHFEAEYVILAAPGFKCHPERDGTRSDAAIMIDYSQKRIIVAGTHYSGEIKKAVFSIMNYAMPYEGVLPMHCSANVGPNGHTAVFFGLSGTGKTTLSADPHRKLIGDDEHGWSDTEVFNFEGGCYAKCIDLSEEQEPDIYHAIRFGAIAENVVMDPITRKIDFFDDSLTMNTRVGYPVDFIENVDTSGIAGLPKAVIFLTADAFGVMPPVSRLNAEQTMYYFLSGFTSKLAGTEVGIEEPVPTFSTCFGQPFLPLDPLLYAQMLKERVEAAGAKVYLVNTGWNGTGKRMPLKYTRAMITAILDGTLESCEYETDPNFGVAVPTTCPGCPDELLSPINTWEDKDAYQEAVGKLARMFHDNFEKNYSHAPEEVHKAGPLLR